MSSSVTSYMPTGNATVSRNADTWSYTFTAPPQALSAYLKFKEMGTNVGAGATILMRIGGSGISRLLVTYNGGYGARFVTPSGSTLSAVATLPAVGNIVELLVTLTSNGILTTTQTINGGTPIAGSASAAKAMPQTWAAQTLEPVVASVNPADIGVIACCVMRGVQSLDTMRRFAGTHTRNG